MGRDEAPTGTRLTPASIALIYLVVGGAWILVSDQLVAALPVERSLVTQLQTVKGWLFVGASALLIYGLVERGRRQLEGANDNLTRALQQASVLHRLLRHNLRNACTVIQLEAEKLAGGSAADGEGQDEQRRPARAIERQVETLLELAEKSRHLRQIALGEQEPITLDLVDVVEAEVERFRATEAAASIELDAPDEAWVRAYPEIEVVVRELLENTVEHYPDRPAMTMSADGGTDSDEAASDGVAVAVGIDRHGDTVTMTVADDGPGLPPMERDVLEEGMERPLRHSQGLGLWVVQAIVGDSGGDLTVEDREPAGTIVSVTLEAASHRSGLLS
jgi:signal transduction histidine kinase